MNLKQRVVPLPWFYVVDPFLRVTAVWCLFSFKIFLFKFGEAGLRPDDLLLLLSLAGLFLTQRIQRTPISRPLRIYLIFVGIEFLSTTWNAMRGRIDFLYSLVFVLRLLEYTIFYFIGYSLARSRFRISRPIIFYFWTVCAMLPLQMAGLVPVPGDFGKMRASGNTNGPYELAIVAAFLMCYLGYKKRSFLKGLLALGIVLLTASRITLMASLLSLLHVGFTRSRSKVKTLSVIVPAAVILGSLYLASASGLLAIGAFDRFENSKSYSLSDIRDVYRATPPVTDYKEYKNGPFEDLNGMDANNFDGDASGLIRFTRWIVLAKSSFNHLDSILIGLGPSFGSAAVDGYLTRCLVETGVLGLLAFLIFISSLLIVKDGSNWYFREFVVIMLISSAFIDIFISYKSMMLLWLWHGMNQYRRPLESNSPPDAQALLPG